MAGKGSRFKEVGYDLPKWMIKSKGKSLFEWSISSLPLSICKKLIFVIQKHESNDFDKFINQFEYFKGLDIKVIEIDFYTKGQAETVYLAKEYINNNEPLLIANIDTKFSTKNLEYDLNDSKFDGVIGAFKSNISRYSYAKTDEFGCVIETAEKVVISDNALTGLYHFKKGSDFISAYEDAIIQNKIISNGEYYIAPLYNLLIQKGKCYKLNYVVDIDILGTPEEIQIFEKK
jgi:dTDP-glucose pyrophosphorylase